MSRWQFPVTDEVVYLRGTVKCSLFFYGDIKLVCEIVCTVVRVFKENNDFKIVNANILIFVNCIYVKELVIVGQVKDFRNLILSVVLFTFIVKHFISPRTAVYKVV